MPVNFKMSSSTVNAVFGYLGIEMAKKEKFETFGLKLELVGDAILVSSPKHNTQTKINTTAVAISSLKQGKLGAVTSGYLRKSIVELIDALPAHPSDWSGLFPQTEQVTVTKDEVKTAKDVLAEASPVIGGINMFPISKLHTAPLVKLRDASMMYQPVKGTGETSRYWVIAISDSIKVAARWQSQTMSIRVEGDGVSHMGSILATLGFNNVKNDYASVHLQVGTDVLLANRTIGAIIASLSEYTALKTPVPSAQVVRSK